MKYISVISLSFILLFFLMSCNNNKEVSVLEKKDSRAKSTTRLDIVERSGTKLMAGSDPKDKRLQMQDAENRLRTGGGLFGEGAGSLASYRGRPGVLRTHPESPAEPVRLFRKFSQGAKVPGKLILSVGHDVRGDWQLQVLANGAASLSNGNSARR